MEKKNADTASLVRLPDDFNPYQALDALLGTATALRALLADDVITEAPIPDETLHALRGLSELAEKLARQFHHYFLAIESLTAIRLPRNAEDFEKLSFRNVRGVREPEPVYTASRH